MRQDLYQAVAWPDGTRSETRVATDVCFCCKTGVATAPDGTVYVAWRHIYPPNLRDMAVARSTDGGRTLRRAGAGQRGRLGDRRLPRRRPVDRGGRARRRAHRLADARPGRDRGKGIFYSYSQDGGRTFAARVRLDEGAGSAHPQLAVADDRVVVVWDQSTRGTPPHPEPHDLERPEGRGVVARPGPPRGAERGAARQLSRGGRNLGRRGRRVDRRGRGGLGDPRAPPGPRRGSVGPRREY